MSCCLPNSYIQIDTHPKLKPSLLTNGEEKEGMNLTELLQALDGQQQEFREEKLYSEASNLLVVVIAKLAPEINLLNAARISHFSSYHFDAFCFH